jgi:quinoprotein glucose dehydrogenase
MREFHPLTLTLDNFPLGLHKNAINCSGAILRFILLGFLIFPPTRIKAAESTNAAIPGTSSLQNSQESDGEKAIKRFRVAPGLKVDLFASEPLIANPVSFAFDEKGRVYVVETYRRRTSVYDIRNHPDWLDADFSFRTVEDRANFFKKVLVPENKSLPARIIQDQNGDGRFDYHDLEVESERIRLLEDRDGDGRADHAVTFAEDFKTSVSGVAAGVLVRNSNVWFTCIPDLWLLRDSDGDGKADFRKSLLNGFGVHISYGGHDMHGLRFGPDGKLYFSIADRGLNVTTEGRTVAYPDSGAVMRCNPDGSEFELVATGLRNPQELAFDQFGNLWTGDNNGDGGDKARWVYVVEGGDSGWHIGWQHLPKMGPWNAEKLWELPGINTAAYILPPIAHIGHGPAGLAFYPGTGLPVQYDNHFFLSDFPGGVHSFAHRPKGAAYEVVDLKEFLWNLYPVDVAFGSDGGAYVADWVEGWEKTGKGRIYRVYDPAVAKDALVRETKKLLAEGMQRRSQREQTRLLDHIDMRVRMEAQFALAEKGVEVTNRLYFRAATRGDNSFLLGRLHSIWALGQIGRTNPATFGCVFPLLGDGDAEVRAQAAKVLGDGRVQEAYEPLVRMLQDPSPRVRFFAALGVGKMGHQEATEPIFQMLRENADQDLYLRHAGVMALVWLNDVNALIAAAKETSASVRMAALLAMRRLNRPEAAMFLYDTNSALVLEAARAVYDLPITSAFSQLAAMISKSELPEPVVRRALNANFRMGNLENAIGLAEFATQKTHPENLRVEALQLLGQWGKPPYRDPVIGLWRPLAPRENRAATFALRPELPKVWQEGTDPLRIAAIRTAVQLDMSQVAPALFDLATNTQHSGNLRLEAFKALALFKDPRLANATTLALADSNPLLRQEAGRLLALTKPADAIGQIAAALEKGSTTDKQSALATLASMDNPVTDQIILSWLDLLQPGQVPKELQLDLLEAAAKRTSATVKAKLAQFEASRPKTDPLAVYRESLFGGDAKIGRSIFFERADAGCLRCHKIKGEGGEVGPDLSVIGATKSREYLLESILFPNKDIAAGYENFLVTLKSGNSFAGRQKNETERELLLVTPDDGLVVLSKSQIQSREKGLSAMPAELATLLTKRELRNLVEFLASLK